MVKSSEVPDAVRAAVAADPELLLLWGGDGTVQRALDTVARKRMPDVPIAVLPAGTSNLFASNFDIPCDLSGALDVAFGGVRRRIDVGSFNGERFGVMAGVGFDALMIGDASRRMKDRLGRAAYVYTGLKNLKKASVHAEVCVDDRLWFTGSTPCVLVGNVGDLFGGITLLHEADPSDGRLDIAVLHAERLSEWARLAGRAVRGEADQSPVPVDHLGPTRRCPVVASDALRTRRRRPGHDQTPEGPDQGAGGHRLCAGHRKDDPMSSMAPVREVTNSEGFERLARLGLATRAAIYLLIGWLAVLVARGEPGKEADQRGALQEVTRHTGGTLLLWVIVVGLIGYSLWRFSEAAFGVTGEGRKKGPRIKSFVRGCIYAFFAASALNLLITSAHSSLAHEEQLLTARVMTHSWGRWAVGIVGAVVLGVGAMLVYEGLARKFEKRLKEFRMTATQRKAVVVLGVVGTTARGLVFGLVGVFLIRAAVDFDSHKARGLDGALRSLAHTDAGPWMLYAAAAGLLVFGIYAMVEAVWART